MNSERGTEEVICLNYLNHSMIIRLFLKFGRFLCTGSQTASIGRLFQRIKACCWQFHNECMVFMMTDCQQEQLWNISQSPHITLPIQRLCWDSLLHGRTTDSLLVVAICCLKRCDFFAQPQQGTLERITQIDQSVSPKSGSWRI